MSHAVKVMLFSCLFFISVSASAHALETKQLTLQSNPFKRHYIGVVEKNPIIEGDQEDTSASQEEEAQQPAPEGDPLPTPEPAPITHMIAAGESLSQIAEMHQTTWNRIFAKNTVIENPDVIAPGVEIIIPNKDEVVSERALPVAPAPQAVVATASTTPTYTPAAQQSYTQTAGNTYAAGYCTWYAKNRRPDLPNMLGNAGSWVASAAARGYATGTVPRVGAIGQQGNHVVYVEGVNPDGTVSISEMNYGGGLFVVHYRTVAASSFTYIY